MEANESRELIRAMRRIAEAVEAIELKLCGPRPAPQVPADKPTDLVSAVRFHRDPRPDPQSDFPSSTTTREKFWSEGDR